MTDDLVTWQRAQLDKDERMAHRIADAEYFHGVSSDAEAEVLTLAAPDRVLAEVDAKRRILDLHSSPDPSCDECGHLLPCPTVRLQALPYADRDGYREEWRP